MRVRTLYDVYRNEALFGVAVRADGKAPKVVVVTVEQAEAVDAWLPDLCSLTAAAELGEAAEEGLLDPVHFEGPTAYVRGYVVRAALQIAVHCGRRRIEPEGPAYRRTFWFVRAT